MKLTLAPPILRTILVIAVISAGVTAGAVFTGVVELPVAPREPAPGSELWRVLVREHGILPVAYADEQYIYMKDGNIFDPSTQKFSKLIDLEVNQKFLKAEGDLLFVIEYAEGREGKLLAFNRGGRLLSSTSLLQEYTGAPAKAIIEIEGGIAYLLTPVVYTIKGGLVYMENTSRIEAIDVKTGSIVWERELHYESPYWEVHAAVDREAVYVIMTFSTYDGTSYTIYRLDKLSGSPEGMFHLSSSRLRLLPYGGIEMRVVASDGLLHLISISRNATTGRVGERRGYVNSTVLLVVQTIDGREGLMKWEWSEEYFTRERYQFFYTLDAFVKDGGLYITFKDFAGGPEFHLRQKVYLFNAAVGTTTAVWEPEALIKVNPILAGDKLYSILMTPDARLHLVALNPNNLVGVWSYEVTKGFLGGFVDAYGMWYVNKILVLSVRLEHNYFIGIKPL